MINLEFFSVLFLNFSARFLLNQYLVLYSRKWFDSNYPKFKVCLIKEFLQKMFNQNPREINNEYVTFWALTAIVIHLATYVKFLFYNLWILGIQFKKLLLINNVSVFWKKKFLVWHTSIFTSDHVFNDQF